MKISEIMSKNPECIEEATSVREAIEKMKNHKKNLLNPGG